MGLVTAQRDARPVAGANGQVLLRRLGEAGFRIDIIAHLRVRRVLAALGEGAEAATVKDALRSCVVSNRNQIALFDQVFDALPRHAPSDGLKPNENPDDAPTSREDETDPIGRRSPPIVPPPKIPRRIAVRFACLVFAAAALVTLVKLVVDFINDGPIPPPPPWPPSPTRIVLTPLELQILTATVCLLVIAVAGRVFWRSFRKKQPDGPNIDKKGPTPSEPLRPPPASPPVVFRAGLVGGALTRLIARDLDEIAEAVTFAPAEEDRDSLDAPATLRRTIESAGLATIVHGPRRRVRRLVIVEDIWAHGRHWNPVGGELARGLEARGVGVVHLPFAGTFADQGGSGGAGTAFASILDAVATMAPAVALVITDGAHIRGTDVERLQLIADLAPVAWLDHRDPDRWDAALRIPIAAGVPFAPADAAGIKEVLATLAEEAGRSRAATSGSGRGAMSSLGLEARVAYCLGAALDWARDCSIIQPISPALAETLRADLHPDIDPLAFGRMCELTGTEIGPGGLTFDHEVADYLLRGFRGRQPRARARAAALVGTAIREELAKVGDEPLFRQGGEWTRLRAEFLADANAETVRAIRALATEKDAPLAATIAAGMLPLVSPQASQPDRGPIVDLRRLPSLDDLVGITGTVPALATRTGRVFDILSSGFVLDLPGRAADAPVALLDDGSALIGLALSDGSPGVTIADNSLRAAAEAKLPPDGTATPVAGVVGDGTWVVAVLATGSVMVGRQDAIARSAGDALTFITSTQVWHEATPAALRLQVDPDTGRVLVAQRGRERIVIVDPSAGTARVEESGPFLDVALPERGGGFVVCEENGRILRFGAEAAGASEIGVAEDGGIPSHERAVCLVQPPATFSRDPAAPLRYLAITYSGYLVEGGPGAAWQPGVRYTRPFAPQIAAAHLWPEGDAIATIDDVGRLDIRRTADGIAVLASFPETFVRDSPDVGPDGRTRRVAAVNTAARSLLLRATDADGRTRLEQCAIAPASATVADPGGPTRPIGGAAPQGRPR